MPLDPQIAGVLQFMAAAGTPPLNQQTPQQARAGFRTLTVDLADPATIVPVDSVVPDTIADVPVRVYRDGEATSATDVPTIVFLHGGGFVIGDLDTHDNSCRRLVRDTGSVVVSVDYPLAPEHPYPAAHTACWSVLQEVASGIGRYGGDAGRLVVGGDSAGGNLAAVCAQLAAAAGLPLAAQLLLYPAVDMLGDYPSRSENATGYFLTVEDMEWFAAQYLGTGDAAVHRAEEPTASPLRAESLAGVAPAIVATAEFDPLRDEGEAYAAALEQAGVEVELRRFDGLIHGFYGMEALSAAADAATTWVNGRLAARLGTGSA